MPRYKIVNNIKSQCTAEEVEAKEFPTKPGE